MKVCAWCGVEFVPWRNYQKYCGNVCAGRAKFPEEYKCECGEWATVRIYFKQLSGDGVDCLGYLAMCEDCKQLALETDPTARLEPWTEYDKANLDKTRNPSGWR